MKLGLASTTVALEFLDLISIFLITRQAACQGDLVLGVISDKILITVGKNISFPFNFLGHQCIQST